MSDIVIVYTLFGDTESARTVCRALVEERLAACANLLGGAVSIYAWEGKIQEEGEVPVILKTRSSLRERLIERLAELHPYTVPAILAWDAAAHPAYAEWLIEQTAD